MDDSRIKTGELNYYSARAGRRTRRKASALSLSLSLSLFLTGPNNCTIDLFFLLLAWAICLAVSFIQTSLDWKIRGGGSGLLFPSPFHTHFTASLFFSLYAYTRLLFSTRDIIRTYIV